MRTTRLALVLAFVAGGGCVCVTADTTADLTIFYTFDGLRCDAAGVRTILVDVRGVDVADGSAHEVRCATFTDGITIHALRDGNYLVDLEGWDDRGAVLYARYEVPVTVRGGAVNEYDLMVPSL